MSGTNGYLSVDAILEADDVQTEDVTVPEWGGKVRVRALTVAQQSKLLAEAADDDQKLQGFLFIHSVVEPKFSLAHFPALQEKSGRAMRRVMEVVLRLNGLGKGQVAAEEARFQEGPEAGIPVPTGA